MKQSDSAFSDENRTTAAEPVVSALRDGIPSAVRALLDQIAVIANNYDFLDLIDDDLANYQIWKDGIELAEAYGNGSEDDWLAKQAKWLGLCAQVQS
jgi:hypothetical protein